MLYQRKNRSSGFDHLRQPRLWPGDGAGWRRAKPPNAMEFIYHEMMTHVPLLAHGNAEACPDHRRRRRRDAARSLVTVASKPSPWWKSMPGWSHSAVSTCPTIAPGPTTIRASRW
ncbi:hypothetical protein LNP17_05470 [Klebsiella variicola subsp. variicola]|nr:hypothetical protein [Klebsiella variicola subsp. variicola]